MRKGVSVLHFALWFLEVHPPPHILEKSANHSPPSVHPLSVKANYQIALFGSENCYSSLFPHPLDQLLTTRRHSSILDVGRCQLPSPGPNPIHLLTDLQESELRAQGIPS